MVGGALRRVAGRGLEVSMAVQCDAAGRAFIEREEGVVLRRYNDSAGIPTIGCGHRILSSEMAIYPAGCTITQEQADSLLANDLRVAESAVSSHSPNGIGQNMANACISLAFNVGGGAFATSSVARLMASGDWHGAADAILLFDKLMVGGKLVPSQALAARRMRERTMFLLDVSTTDDVA
jgi:lysozyme